MQVPCAGCNGYLCYHGESQDEEAKAAHQRELGLVFAQVCGELVGHGRHDGLNGGKLGEGGQKIDMRNGWTGGKSKEELINF